MTDVFHLHFAFAMMKINCQIKLSSYIQCINKLFENFTTSFSSVAQEKQMEKQRLLYQQARLHHRGASEMVLQTISASKGGERLNTELHSLYQVEL